jgi:predicted aspartyl protease
MKIIINDTIRVQALVDTGASVTAMNIQTLRLIREQGQRCKLYACDKDIHLTSISGNKLNIIGQAFIRINLGQHLLYTRVFVIAIMRSPSFVLGTDVLSKHKIIINYETDQLGFILTRVYIR